LHVKLDTDPHLLLELVASAVTKEAAVAAAAVDVEALQMVLQDLLDLTANQVVMVNPVVLVMMALQVNLLQPLLLLHPAFLSAQLDLPVQAEIQVQRDLQEMLDQLARATSEVDKDLQDHQDLPDHPVNLETMDSLAAQVSQESSPTDRHLKAHLDPLDHKDHQDLQDQVEIQAQMDNRARKDLQETTAVQEDQEIQDPTVKQDPKAKTAARESVLTVLHQELPQVIKPSPFEDERTVRFLACLTFLLPSSLSLQHKNLRRINS